MAINAGGKTIANAASGGTTDTNAANIGDVKAVANLSQNLNITDGTLIPVPLTRKTKT